MWGFRSAIQRPCWAVWGFTKGLDGYEGGEGSQKGYMCRQCCAIVNRKDA